MAKSRETFNKKEKEKKRDKKKKEKEEKKEARKSNPKGSFDDMIAYVDENGNITSTPPDPTKKKTIQQEDIKISISKQEDAEPMDVIRKGTVTFFNESKGYGFIRDLETQESVFVHSKGLTEPIGEKDKVTFEVEMTPKGPSAIDVKIVR